MAPLFLADDVATAPALSWFLKPIAYVAAFFVYGYVTGTHRTRAQWMPPLFAGLLRTALGYALGAAAVLLVTTLPAVAIQAFLGISRFGIWFGIARLFFPKSRGAVAFAALGVALNLLLDWTLLGGVVTAPA